MNEAQPTEKLRFYRDKDGMITVQDPQGNCAPFECTQVTDFVGQTSGRVPHQLFDLAKWFSVAGPESLKTGYPEGMEAGFIGEYSADELVAMWAALRGGLL